MQAVQYSASVAALRGVEGRLAADGQTTACLHTPDDEAVQSVYHSALCHCQEQPALIGLAPSLWRHVAGLGAGNGLQLACLASCYVPGPEHCAACKLATQLGCLMMTILPTD